MSGLVSTDPSSADICHWRSLELERSETSGEFVLLVLAQVLAGKDQQGVLEPSPMHGLECGAIDRSKLDAMDDRAKGCVHRLDV